MVTSWHVLPLAVAGAVGRSNSLPFLLFGGQVGLTRVPEPMAWTRARRRRTMCPVPGTVDPETHGQQQRKWSEGFSGSARRFLERLGFVHRRLSMEVQTLCHNPFDAFPPM